MVKRSRRGDKRPAPIIRREGSEQAPHHGGAWKVAYADFVTAMMAFFLIMWLLNATTEDQRKGLADYFSPSNLMSHASSGTGLAFGGRTAFDQGALVSDRGAVQVVDGTRPIVTQPEADPGNDPAEDEPAPGRTAPASQAAPAPLKGEAARSARPLAETGAKEIREAASGVTPAPAESSAKPPKAANPAAKVETAEQFEHAVEEIRRKLQSDPALAAIAKQVLVDVTPKGLRVQLLDADQQSMFATGSAEPNERARLVIQKLVPVLQNLPGGLAIEGHTDAAPYPGPERTNWELSAERANAARRMLTEAGVPAARIQEVTGHADHDLLVPNQPFAAANRRIAIIVLRPAAKPPN
jgi:chemotaxis protein MotB